MNRGMWGFAALALGMALAATPVFAAIEADALKHAAGRGRLLYAYDQAAWVSTDELLKALPDPHSAGVAGYVIEPTADGQLRAVYYRMDGDVPLAVFTADVRGRTVTASRLLAASDDANLGPLAARQVKALVAAKAEAAKRKLWVCAQDSFNAIALPPDAPDGPIPVYLLTPQTKTGEYPFGGHYEIDIGADGRVAGARAFAKSCINISATNTPKGAKTVAVFITHLLDPTPTEIHVYLSLWMGETVFVSTKPKGIWKVDGDRITPESLPAK